MSKPVRRASVSIYCKIYTENFSQAMIDRYATGKEIYNFLLRDAKCSLPLRGDCNLWYLGCNEKFGSIIYRNRSGTGVSAKLHSTTWNSLSTSSIATGSSQRNSIKGY